MQGEARKVAVGLLYRRDGRAVFDKSLKEHIVFSDHSLATDSAFAEVQLVSCRNVLICFNRALQERALDLFRQSLCRQGFLGLSPSGLLHSLRRTRANLSKESFAMMEAGGLRRGIDGILIGASTGGVTVVQQPETAQSPQMALAALRLRPADHVLSLDGIAALLHSLPTAIARRSS